MGLLAAVGAALVPAACLALAAALVVPAGRGLERLRAPGAGGPQASATVRASPRGRAARGRAARGGGRGVGADGVDQALAADLMAAAMRAGAPATAALDVVGAALGGPGEQLRQVAALLAMGADETTAWARADPGWAPLARCLSLSASSGAPAAELLRQAAERSRVERAARRRAAAARLEVLVLLPTGLCALPAFAALGVVPLVLALAGGLGGW